MEHTYENCHNLTCRRKERDFGYNNALEELQERIDEEYYDGGYGDYHEVAMIVRMIEQMYGGHVDSKVYLEHSLVLDLIKEHENRANHDSELLDKVMQKQRTIIDEDGVMYRVVLLKDIEDMKAEVSK